MLPLRLIVKHNKNLYSVLIIMFVLFYTLFGFRRMKQSYAFEIDSVSLSNELWLLPLLLFLKYILNQSSQQIERKAIGYRDYSLFLLYVCLIIYILLRGFNIENINQFFYSVALLIIPMAFIFSIKVNDLNYFNSIIKLLVLLCFLYSLLAIIASTSYASLMELIGNQTKYSLFFILFGVITKKYQWEC